MDNNGKEIQGSKGGEGREYINLLFKVEKEIENLSFEEKKQKRQEASQPILGKAIYASSSADVVNGMTFSDTLIYLVFATSLFNFMDAYIVWDMQNDIQTGKIILDIIKPMKYQVYCFAQYVGKLITSFFITLLPTFLIVYCATKGYIALNVNMIFFSISVICAIVINYCFDFMVGTICLYSQSTWGINMMKEVVVMLLSGVLVPVAFYPPWLKTSVGLLPFQAIYNIPLKILIDKYFDISTYLQWIGIQLIWVFVMIILSHLFWKKSIRIITINGG